MVNPVKYADCLEGKKFHKIRDCHHILGAIWVLYQTFCKDIPINTMIKINHFYGNVCEIWWFSRKKKKTILYHNSDLQHISRTFRPINLNLGILTGEQNVQDTSLSLEKLVTSAKVSFPTYLETVSTIN